MKLSEIRERHEHYKKLGFVNFPEYNERAQLLTLIKEAQTHLRFLMADGSVLNALEDDKRIAIQRFLNKLD